LDVFEAGINGVSWIYRRGDTAAPHVLNADNIEKKTGLCGRDVVDHYRPLLPIPSIG
jgi:hypothetical protein